MKVSILIPVYNEFLTLPLVVQRVLDAPLPRGCEKEIVIVNDGSTDGTKELLGELLGELLERYRAVVTVHHSSVNQGKGAALRLGLAKAAGDIFLVQDGDLEYDPKDYAPLLEPLVSGRAKIVYGSRFLNDASGQLRGMKWRNWVANKTLTLAANLLYRARITDEATAYKAFTREVAEALDLRCMRFEFCPEFTAKARRLGYEIVEVPISYNPRGILEGKKIRWQDGVEALWTLLKYRGATMRSFDRRAASARVRAAVSQSR